MSVEYTWKVVQLERNVQDGGVIMAHWDCVGVDTETNASNRVYGATSFTPPDPTSENFIPFEELTEEMVLGWLWNSGVDKTATEANIASAIDTINNPPVVSGLPW